MTKNGAKPSHFTWGNREVDARVKKRDKKKKGKSFLYVTAQNSKRFESFGLGQNI